MNILIVTATPFESTPLLDYLESNFERISFFSFKNEKLNVSTLVTGVGGIQTGLGIARYPGLENMDLVINMGIAGAFQKNMELGTVVEVIRDRFGDLGVEEADGRFTDVFEMQLAEANTYPYVDGWLIQPEKNGRTLLPKVSSVSVNKVTGTNNSALALFNKYHPDIESMEGAAFMLACLMADAPFVQIRSLSNYVDNRNRSSWKIEEAIDRLNTFVISYLDRL